MFRATKISMKLLGSSNSTDIPIMGWLSSRAYLGAWQRRLIPRGTMILTYHRIGTPPAWVPDPFLYDTAEELDSHLSRARESGLQFVSYSETVTSEEYRPYSMAITFDDGFRSVLREGLPVLLRQKVRAIQFVVAGLMGQKNVWDEPKRDSLEPLMDESEVREWLAAGQEIGSHTLTHPNLKKVTVAKAREEISGSKKMLEDRFGVPIHHFCYPHGGWTPVVRDLVIDAGYKSACGVQVDVADAASDPWVLPRVAPLPSGRLAQKLRHRMTRRLNGSRSAPINP